MTDQELIVEQARQIMELQKQLATESANSELWYKKFKELDGSSMRCKPLAIDDTVPDLKGADFHA